MRRFYQAGRLDDREDRQVSRASLPNSGVISVGETWSVSWEDITPPSSLILAHSPLPLGSLLLRHLASFRESLQVVTSPCCPRQLPDVSSESLSLDAGSPTPAVHRVLAPVSSTVSSAFPNRMWVGFPHLSCERLLAGQFSRMQIFRNVPASKFARPPDRSYRCEYYRRAAGAFTSGHIVLCCRRTHQIC
jgi:hypothetical protein